MSDRLEMVVEGRRQTALATEPDLKCPASLWSGFLIEEHKFESFELPDHWIPFYMVNLQSFRTPAKRSFFEGGKQHECTIRDGDCVVVAPHEVRRFRFEGKGKGTLVAIEPIVFQEMVVNHSRSPSELLRRWNGQDFILRKHIQTLRSELAAGCPRGPLFGECVCATLAEQLLQRYSIDRIQLDRFKGGLSGAQLRRTMEYIEEYLHLNLTGAQLARIAGLSKYHFGKAFKQRTGVTLHSYVLSRRVQRSQELLVASDLPLSAVAEAAGFSDQSHFTSVFSTRVGISPGVYRNIRSRVSVFVNNVPSTLQAARSRSY